MAEKPAETPVEESKAEQEAAETPSKKSAPLENENGASRIAKNSSISIKSSLRQELPQPSSEESALDEKQGGQITGQESLEVPGETSAPDPERILKAWYDYTASIEKARPRVFSTLQNNKPRLNDEGVIEVMLISETQRENFNKNIKGELSAFIRKETGMSVIDIVAGVTETQRDVKKIYTDQDRLEYLINKNAELGELKTRFGLDFDN